MKTLPVDYCPSVIDLPFNRASLLNNYRPATPDQDPGGEGVWLALQEMNLLTVEGEKLPEGDSPFLTTDSPPLYIGQWQDRPCRLLHIPSQIVLPSHLQKQSLRATEPQLSIELLSLAGVGQMILHWEHSSRHCGHCGGKMIRFDNEWGKRCQACNNNHFPRIHPCVIGLIIKKDEILLAHKAEWDDGRYSLVAGFVEFGECLEEAMIRETAEETNIQIKNIRYIGSQSWPFPSQLMCGFVAEYAGGEIELRDKELADAKWCKLNQLPTLPPKRSIARHLIDRAGEFMKDLQRN
ncbi:MAG: NAD(+) diphosphatase [Thermodesulfobacteriota bacterium]|nr:NAD(+) diphosphatase [Thermodesulfobacteriota bacterium]